MYYKKVFVIFIAVLCIGFTETKKPRRIKPTEQTRNPFQPDVVAYSTFGFNDVGTYDGFVPSSSDYTGYLNGVDQEPATKLYGPAFPTALDSTGFSSSSDSTLFNYETQEQNQNINHEPATYQYPQNSVNVFKEPSSHFNEDDNKHNHKEDYSSSYTGEINKPIYGAKLNHKTRNKQKTKQYNNTQFNVFNSPYTNPSDDKFFKLSEVSSTYESKPALSEANVSYSNSNIYPQNPGLDATTYPLTSNIYGSLNFPRVVDFTKTNQFDDTADISSALFKPANTGFHLNYENQDGDSFTNSLKQNEHIFKLHDFNINKIKDEKKSKVFSNHGPYSGDDTTENKNYTLWKRPSSEYKKKQKKLWSAANQTNYYKNWKDSSSKDYHYSTNNSHMTYKYTDDRIKDNYNSHEAEPTGSNAFDFTNYKLPETNIAKIKVKPEPDFTKIKPVVEEEYTDYEPFTEKLKQNDFKHEFQSFMNTPSTTTSYWGNAFKPEYFSIKNQNNKPQILEDDIDDTITIPRAPPKFIYNKLQDTTFTDWSYGSLRPKLPNKELFTRFKSEEDLLGLRNHDTSHPSYLPTYYPSSHEADENSGYKKLVNRWKESYLKAKYKDSALRDYENYASETKAVHVPMPRPYPIEVPHPVIEPVPQPFPVRVPVSKPVAMPVVQEITVPIEKPVPYPVIKIVPYPVEKLVPVRVDKEVKVPVPQPYPVEVPYIRPVFHHTKPHEEIEAELEESSNYPQINYRNRPQSSRNRQRPSRTIYERNRGRWPERRRPAPSSAERRRRPTSGEVKTKYHEFRPDFEDDRDYRHCKRTRSC